MKRIFISYSEKDEASYSLLCTALDLAGIERWSVEDLKAGESLAAGLRSAIVGCDLCVFIATSNSLKSMWCLAELGAFWGAGKPVILFLADPALGEDAIPPQFRGVLWTRDARQVIRSIQEVPAGRVRATASGYQFQLGGSTINVLPGRIEHVSCDSPDCLIALPANEYFDDECISDSRSALGAWMQRYHGDRIDGIRQMICGCLDGAPCNEVDKRPDTKAMSYGIGHSVFLDRPFDSPHRVALVSVTTQRADAGLRAAPADIFSAVLSIQRLMANHRLTRVYLPLMGAGHGGLRGEASLLCMLLAFAGGEGVRRPSEINIVVFRANEQASPEIPAGTLRSVLELACECMG